MSVSVNGTNGLTFNDATTQNTSAFYGGLAMRNRIINGAMVIDQRNAGASVTQDASGSQYCLDRWTIYGAVASKFTAQQTPSATETGYATRVAAGFTNYLAITSASAYSVSASDAFQLQQMIEGFNTSDLAWGTANAKTVTLSFLVYSSLTGTFGGSLVNSAANYSYPFTYSIPAANTWTTISVTVSGPTAGTWIGATNGIGIRVYFGLGVGSTNSGTAGSWSANLYRSATGATSVVGTSGATFYITGVQLEKGSTATSFDYRPYGTELALCQRYCQVQGGDGTLDLFAVGTGNSTAFSAQAYKPQVTFRIEPSVSYSALADIQIVQFSDGTTRTITVIGVSTGLCTPNYVVLDITLGTAGTAGANQWLRAASTASARLIFSAEL